MPKNLALKVAIVESGLSQIEVAKACEIDQTRLSHIVNGHRRASDDERAALVRILGRKARRLFPEPVAS